MSPIYESKFSVLLLPFSCIISIERERMEEEWRKNSERGVSIFFSFFFLEEVVGKIITSPTSFSHNAKNTIQCFCHGPSSVSDCP